MRFLRWLLPDIKVAMAGGVALFGLLGTIIQLSYGGQISVTAAIALLAISVLVPIVGLLGFKAYSAFKDLEAIRAREPDTIRVSGQEAYYKALYRADDSIVKSAKQRLYVTGSRSRDPGYLRAIEAALEQNHDLEHLRLLYGRKGRIHIELKQHLKRVLELASRRTLKDGVSSVRIFYVDTAVLDVAERFLCLNENACIIPIQSENELDRYDSGVRINNSSYAARVATALGTIASIEEQHPGITEISSAEQLAQLEA